MDLLRFALIVGKLKRLTRSGWRRYPIPKPESVADHSFRLAILALILSPRVGINQNKAIKMALIHDLGEAETGDVIKYRGTQTLPRLSQKLQKERAALLKILQLVETEEYIDLYDEYVANKTPEAQFVKQLDKLERAIQAREYAQKFKINPTEFLESARSVITDPDLKQLLQKISLK